jgi:hypothetical protein
LVREGIRANLLAGVTPSEAAIVDVAAVRGVEVVCSLPLSAAVSRAAGRLEPYRRPPRAQPGRRGRRVRHLAKAGRGGARVASGERSRARSRPSSGRASSWEGVSDCVPVRGRGLTEADQCLPARNRDGGGGGRGEEPPSGSAEPRCRTPL